MRWVLATLALTISAAAHAESYDNEPARALPAAEALMYGKAHDWQRAQSHVKDRLGDMIFERNFPLKSEMTPDDMIACIDDLSIKAKPTRPVETMIAECGGVPGYGDTETD